MKQPVPMKTISTTSLDAQTQQLIEQAGQGKILAVFEGKDGKPVAAVMPLGSAQEWDTEREAFFETIREMQQTANLTPEEADELALEAVKAVRAGAS